MPQRWKGCSDDVLLCDFLGQMIITEGVIVRFSFKAKDKNNILWLFKTVDTVSVHKSCYGRDMGEKRGILMRSGHLAKQKPL